MSDVINEKIQYWRAKAATPEGLSLDEMREAIAAIPRFEAKYTKGAEHECWEWHAAIDNHGYGAFWFLNRLWKAPRVAYMIANSVYLMPKHKILHKCDNPKCVNPRHLKVGTQADNLADMRAKGREGAAFAKGAFCMPDEKAKRIKEFYEMGGASQSELAYLFGVGQSTIHKAVRGDYV